VDTDKSNNKSGNGGEGRGGLAVVVMHGAVPHAYVGMQHG